MSVIILLILASLAVGVLFVGAFVWSVRSGQYEDTLTPALRVLAEDDGRAEVSAGRDQARQIHAGQTPRQNESPG